METDVRILEIQPYFTREQSRTPLKFGGVVMDSAWLCHVRVLVENRRGQKGEGWGAIFLSDVWGWPSSRVDHPQREDLMVQLVTAWCRRLGEVRAFTHPIDLFWELEPELETLTRDICRDAGAAEEMPRLNALICASAADAAVHDAFGNAAGIDTYLGYGPEHMDHDLSRWLGPSYAGRYVADFLHPLPEQVDAFHLVGGMDKLSETEVTADDPDDGLPVSLDQWFRYEALRCLKVKLVGTDLEWDLNRLLEVYRLARTEQRHLDIDELWLTADTNEMCDTPQYMVELLVRLREENRVRVRLSSLRGTTVRTGPAKTNAGHDGTAADQAGHRGRGPELAGGSGTGAGTGVQRSGFEDLQVPVGRAGTGVPGRRGWRSIRGAGFDEPGHRSPPVGWLGGPAADHSRCRVQQPAVLSRQQRAGAGSPPRFLQTGAGKDPHVDAPGDGARLPVAPDRPAI